MYQLNCPTNPFGGYGNSGPFIPTNTGCRLPQPFPCQPPSQTPWLDRVSNNFMNRIGNGMMDGSLVGGEACHLLGDVSSYLQQLQAAKADGVVTASERSQLRGEAVGLSREIYQMRHNQLGNQLPSPWDLCQQPQYPTQFPPQCPTPFPTQFPQFPQGGCFPRCY